MEETLIHVVKILLDDSFRYDDDKIDNALTLISANHPEIYTKAEKESEKDKLSKEILKLQTELKSLQGKYETL
jgi:hypothetical protein